MAYNAPVEHRTGTLVKAVGPYPAGCLITTDCKVATTGSKAGDNTVFRVDEKRFAAWVKSGMLKLPVAPKAQKKETVSDG